MMGGVGPSGGHLHHRASSMQGIGNPMFADPRLAQHGGAYAAGGGTLGTLGEMASNVGGAMLEMIRDPLARNVDLNSVGGRGGGGHGGGGGVGGGGGYNPDARPDPVSFCAPPPTVPPIFSLTLLCTGSVSSTPDDFIVGSVCIFFLQRGDVLLQSIAFL